MGRSSARLGRQVSALCVPLPKKKARWVLAPPLAWHPPSGSCRPSAPWPRSHPLSGRAGSWGRSRLLAGHTCGGTAGGDPHLTHRGGLPQTSSATPAVLTSAPGGSRSSGQAPASRIGWRGSPGPRARRAPAHFVVHSVLRANRDRAGLVGLGARILLLGGQRPPFPRSPGPRAVPSLPRYCRVSPQ